jgi:hypothetical protein
LLVFNPAASLSVLLFLTVVLWTFSKVFYVSDHVSWKQRYKFTSFPILIPFISVSYLIALARTFSTMLNRSGGSGQTCFVPGLKDFHHWVWCLAMGYIYMTFVMLMWFPLIPRFLRVYIKCMKIIKQLMRETENNTK